MKQRLKSFIFDENYTGNMLSSMKQRFLFILHSTFYIFHFAAAQSPSIQWQRCYGGSNVDRAFSCVQTNDGGYIIGGTSRSNDGDVTFHYGSDIYTDYWLVKTDAAGSIEWQKTYGGSNTDKMNNVIQTSDSGYLLTGWTYSSDGDVTGASSLGDVWVVKVNASGSIQWQNAMGGTGPDNGNKAFQTADGGYIISGNTSSTNGDVSGNHGASDYWLVKLDTGGVIQWQKCFGGSSTEEEPVAQQTSDGGYILAGASYSNDSDVSGHHGALSTSDCWVVKMDSARNIQWQHSFGGTKNEEEVSIRETPEGDFVIAATSFSNDGDVTSHHGASTTSDVWVFKLDAGGNMIWQKSMGGTSDDKATWISMCNGGGYIISGFTSSTDGDVTNNQGGEDQWLIKTDTAGNIQWQKTIGGTANDEATSIQQTNDGGFILCGVTASDDGDISGNHGTDDFSVVKLSAETGIDAVGSLTNSIEVYPNPVATLEAFYIKGDFSEALFIISDVTGRVLHSQWANRSQLSIVNCQLNTGIYFVKVNDKGSYSVRKIVVE
jgi:hypothetical protein